MLLEIILLAVPSSAGREEYLTYHSYLHDSHIHIAGRLDYQRSNFRSSSSFIPLCLNIAPSKLTNRSLKIVCIGCDERLLGISVWTLRHRAEKPVDRHWTVTVVGAD